MTKGIVDALHDRAATYRLFARLFGTEVDRALLGELVAFELPRATVSRRIDEGCALMASFLESTACKIEAARTELAVDYARLFVVRGKGQVNAAYPFESVYASSDGLTVSDARTAVKALYRAAGVWPETGWNVGEDHIALELDFMATLAQRSADALETGDEQAALDLLGQQRAFLDEHLLKWVPSLCAAIGRNARTAFYQGLALFVQGYLEEDRATLQDVLA